MPGTKSTQLQPEGSCDNSPDQGARGTGEARCRDWMAFKLQAAPRPTKEEADVGPKDFWCSLSDQVAFCAAGSVGTA